jgi:hypothetical protein
VIRDSKVIFIFVDGLGIGTDHPEINPLAGGRFPALEGLIATATPLDACLGVPGLPQSATGQASLLTGINAPKMMGRHVEGFPPPTLKKLIEHENLFSRLHDLGKRSTFANCYLNVDPHELPSRKQSVTTVMTLSALGHVRANAELAAGKAVCHDITRWTMGSRGYEGPLIEPEEAAGHLIAVAREHDLTLFEHFLTDRAGHSGDLEQAARHLEILERFVQRALRFTEEPDHLFVMTSDHGNIEDLSVRTHTTNPVPLIAVGAKSDLFASAADLCDVVPALLRVYAS